MPHLIKNAGGDLSSYPLSGLWPMMKTEIFSHGLEFKCWRADVDNSLYLNEFRLLLSVETRRQCRQYGSQLGLDEEVRYAHESVVFLQQFNNLEYCVEKTKTGQTSIVFLGTKTPVVLLDILNDIEFNRYGERVNQFIHD
jgi:hypothetical protein